MLTLHHFPDLSFTSYMSPWHFRLKMVKNPTHYLFHLSPGSVPGWGTKIPQAVWCDRGEEKKKSSDKTKHTSSNTATLASQPAFPETHGWPPASLTFTTLFPELFPPSLQSCCWTCCLRALCRCRFPLSEHPFPYSNSIHPQSLRMSWTYLLGAFHNSPISFFQPLDAFSHKAPIIRITPGFLHPGLAVGHGWQRCLLPLKCLHIIYV